MGVDDMLGKLEFPCSSITALIAGERWIYKADILQMLAQAVFSFVGLATLPTLKGQNRTGIRGCEKYKILI